MVHLQEGNGEAVYEIGVEDNGTPKGLPPHDFHKSISIKSSLLSLTH